MTVVLDQENWGHIAVTGDDRTRFLQGLVTGNVKALKPGEWLRTMLLTHKARVVSIFEVHAFADYYLLSCSPDLTDKTFETLDRHIVMDDVELERRELAMHTLWQTSEDVWTAAPLLSTAPSASSEAEIERMRIEAGMPLYGVDVSEDHFPFESLLVRLIDYDKGCFAGQEPVSRVYHRGGGGSKRLMGLRVAGDTLLEVGAILSSDEKPKAGVVSSVTQSPDFGNIALAHVHKSAWEEGSIVRLGDRKAEVVPLPFV